MAPLQARWPDESALLMLPEMDRESVGRLERAGWGALTDLLRALQGGSRDATLKKLRQELGAKVLCRLTDVKSQTPTSLSNWGARHNVCPPRRCLQSSSEWRCMLGRCIVRVTACPSISDGINEV